MDYSSLARFVLLLVAAGPAAAQATWYVDSNAPAGGDGSLGAPWQGIQQAVDTASALDEVRIAAGIYEPFQAPVAVNLLGPANGGAIVAVTGATGLTESSMLGSATVGVGPIRIANLVFDGSRAVGPARGLALTGIKGATVANCDFLENDIGQGTGGGLNVLAPFGAWTIEGATFVGNRASFGGGFAMADIGAGLASELSLQGCLFAENRLNPSPVWVPSGSAISAYVALGDFRVEGCRFERNDLRTLDSDTLYTAVSEIRNCQFESNGGTLDGAVVVATCGSLCAPDVINCTFTGPRNGASLPVSAFPVAQANLFRDCTVIGNPSGRQATLFGVAVRVERCTVLEFHSGPLPIFGSAFLNVVSCTLRGCASSVPVLQSDVEMRGTIIDGHTGPVGTTTRSVRFSNLPGGPALDPTNIEADSFFFAPLAGDLRLAPGSPCVDTGSATEFDPDGTLLDMGAIPFDPGAVPVPLTYCPGKVTSGGCVPELDVSGAPSFAGGLGALLTVTQLPGASFGLFFASPMGVPASTVGPMRPLCTGSPSVRTQVLATGGSGPCTGSVVERLSIIDLASFGFGPLDSLHFQFIARDPANPDGTGYTLSNAVEVLAID